MIRMWGLALLLLAGAAMPAAAAVTLTFYSRELGTYFPHAFVRVTGATDAAPGVAIDANYGFTARHITPALLAGPVGGKIMDVSAGYIRKSDAHLTLVLSDARYAAVLATVAQWRDRPQPSYDLQTANCVFFIGDVARTLGMTVDDPPELMKRPRSYIINLIRLNPGVGTVVAGGRAERALATPGRQRGADPRGPRG